MNEAHLRMTRIPKGGSNPLQGVGVASPLDRQCNREAGVPSIMQAMLDEVAPKPFAYSRKPYARMRARGHRD
jgi:hypothetical protein